MEERHRSCEFIEFLTRLDAAYPASTAIKVILDNHSAHISKETRARLARKPEGRFEFTFTPKHGSWLNLIAGFRHHASRTPAGAGTTGGHVGADQLREPPAHVTCDINPASVQLSEYPGNATCTLTFATTTQAAGNIPITITAEMASFKQSQAATLSVTATKITNYFPIGLTAPRALQPGTSLVINGLGFCQGTRVTFGSDNDKAIATPTLLSLTQMQVTVPRNATTGVTGATTQACPNQDGPRGRQHRARAVCGDDRQPPQRLWLSVHKLQSGLAELRSATELYGQGATYFSTPLGNLRNPLALYVYLPLANAIRNNDLCFGISLSTQRIKNNEWGGVSVADMPNDNEPTHAPWSYQHPDSSSPPPAPLDDFIHV